jgi:hypothetical protein
MLIEKIDTSVTADRPRSSTNAPRIASAPTNSGSDAAEHDHQQHQHDRRRDRLGLHDVVLGLGVHLVEDRDLAADLRVQTRRSRADLRGDLVERLQPVLRCRPGQREHGVRAVLVLGHEHRGLGAPVRRDRGHVGGRQLGQIALDGLPEGRIGHDRRRVAVEHDHVGAGAADVLLDGLDGVRGFGVRRVEAAVGQRAEHAGAPDEAEGDEDTGQGEHQTAPPVGETAERLEHETVSQGVD